MEPVPPLAAVPVAALDPAWERALAMIEDPVASRRIEEADLLRRGGDPDDAWRALAV